MKQTITLELTLNECGNCPGITHELPEADVRNLLAPLLMEGEEITLFVSSTDESVN